MRILRFLHSNPTRNTYRFQFQNILRTSSSVSHLVYPLATSFHEVVEASKSGPSIIRNKDCDLSRRYSGYAPQLSGDHEDIPHTRCSFGKSGVHTMKQEKCSSFPTQELGTQLNSKEMTLAVPPEKFQNLQTECAIMVRKQKCSKHEL